MTTRFFLTFFLSALLLVIGCGNDSKSLPSEKTIVIGKFRFSGSAESGQYAPHLFKLDRLIRDEMGQGKAWKVVESDRSQEIAALLMNGKGMQSLSASKGDALPEMDLPNVQYLVVGEMDGFDLAMADTPALREDAGRKTAATVAGRRRVAFSRMSIRMVDVANKRWLMQKTINFQEPVEDLASAETQINGVLSAMASAIAGEIQLAEAGMPMVAAINSDGTLLLNRGHMHGMRMGQQWSLSRGDKQVINPETGETMADTGRIIGKVEITQILEDHSVANIIGDEFARVGDGVVLNRKNQARQKSSIQPVRVAIGGFVLGPEVDRSLAGSGFFPELESRLLHLLQRDSGMKVVEQDSINIKRMLTQQMLTDLNKGREPGLPMGTLSGVDYLVFGKIHTVNVTAPADLQIKALDQTVKGGIPSSGLARAHIYLQDVNTGELVLSEEINIKQTLSGKNAAESRTKLLYLFSDEINRQFLLGLRPLRIEVAGLDDVMLNHGPAVGLTKGMELTAYSIGERHRDVYTGQMMDGMGSQPAARLEISGFSAQGWARARIIRGNPQKGMPVAFAQASTPAFGAIPSDEQGTQQTPTETGIKRIAIAGFGVTDNVKQTVGNAGSQLLTELEENFINRLVHDSGFEVVDLKPSHVRMLIDQFQMKNGQDAVLPAGLLEGVDYLFYGRLISAELTPGTKKYIEAVGATVHQPGHASLNASLFLQDMQNSNYALHENLNLNEPWKNKEQAKMVWSRLFAKLTKQGMAKALLTLRPLAVDWVNQDMIGINHGRSADLQTGDMLDAFTAGETKKDPVTGSMRRGVGARVVGRLEITGFNPDGWAEGKLVKELNEGNALKAGMRLKLVEISARKHKNPDQVPKTNW